MFRRLQTKLAVLYGALFGVLLSLLGAAVYTAVAGNVEHAVQGELVANGAVFDRLWALRSQQLHDGANLLARDFGFRAAVATRDAETTRSALENLRGRLGLDRAFIVDLDANVTGLDAKQLDDGATALWTALNQSDNASGVLMIDGQPYQAISAPILAPAAVGWGVFAVKLDRAELASLERLSAAPLKGALLTRRTGGGWRVQGATATSGDLRTLARFATDSFSGRRGAQQLSLASGRAIALTQPLKTMDSGEQAALLLRYPMDAAMAPYRPMMLAILALGGLSLLGLLIGSGLLARGVTRPLAALDEAARRLARGEDARVEVDSADEIGSLAISFNTMAAEIGERERRISHLAFNDAETDLPNRRALVMRLEDLGEAGGAGLTVTAAFGLERFTLVRSAIGYRLTGMLLKELADRITERRPDLNPSRLSTSIIGVTFRAADLDEAQVVLSELVQMLDQPVRLESTTVDVGMSVGLAALGVHAHGAAALVERANIALDQALASRRKIAVFDEAAYGDPASNLPLMSEMLGAVATGELALHYQPKLDLRSGRICGLEALVRWRHPVRGMIPPDLFVSMAEETGHIRALSDWVLDRAIADQATLRDGGVELQISVNISGRLAGDRDFAARCMDRIAEAKANLCFEITETAVIDNPEAALELIDAYAAAGVPISIDDYGSGLSSLAYLKQIAAQELKIDKAFVLTLAAGRREALIVKSTVDLAHALGLKVVAEGVETAECQALLRTMGCDVAQGYHIARPMGLPALVEFLAAERFSEETAKPPRSRPRPSLTA